MSWLLYNRHKIVLAKTIDSARNLSDSDTITVKSYDRISKEVTHLFYDKEGFAQQIQFRALYHCAKTLLYENTYHITLTYMDMMIGRGRPEWLKYRYQFYVKM